MVVTLPVPMVYPIRKIPGAKVVTIRRKKINRLIDPVPDTGQGQAVCYGSGVARLWRISLYHAFVDENSPTVFARNFAGFWRDDVTILRRMA